jgi:hypothetical protein
LDNHAVDVGASVQRVERTMSHLSSCCVEEELRLVVHCLPYMLRYFAHVA